MLYHFVCFGPPSDSPTSPQVTLNNRELYVDALGVLRIAGAGAAEYRTQTVGLALGLTLTPGLCPSALKCNCVSLTNDKGVCLMRTLG